MGAEESVPIPPPPPSAYPDQRYSPYFMFSLYYDTLHLVYAPPEIANLIVKTATLALGANSIQYHKPKLEHGYKIVFHETLFRLVNRCGFAFFDLMITTNFDRNEQMTHSLFCDT